MPYQQCRVPESTVELFDCCNDNAEDVCTGLGTLTLLALSAMIFFHIYFLVTNKWYRT